MDLQYVTPCRNGGPGPASPPAKSFEFRDNYPPAYAIERAAMSRGRPATAPPPATRVNTKLTRASEVRA
jgi:hypothetical protein